MCTILAIEVTSFGVNFLVAIFRGLSKTARQRQSDAYAAMVCLEIPF